METIRNDIDALSGELEHRQTGSEQEDLAADYVLDRIKPYVDRAHKTRFNVVSNFRVVLAGYYAEFAFTCLLAFFWPTVALVYGTTIFLAYFGEFAGFPVFSRFFAQLESESSSVVGFKAGTNRDRLIIFTAYLDTDTVPRGASWTLNFRRWLHRALVAGMVLVLAACLIDAYGAWFEAENALTVWIRSGGMVFFGLAAAVVLWSALRGSTPRGANHNASGVAAVLRIAEALHEAPLHEASVLYYFSGGHFANMAGMHALVDELHTMPGEAYIINLEGVGAGTLCYTETEGVLRRLLCSEWLIVAAEKHAREHQAKSCRVRNVMTNAYLPLVRGHNAITLIGLDDKGSPVHHSAAEDNQQGIACETIATAAHFAESIARTVAHPYHDLPGPPG